MTARKINRILVPTDFSETADQALRYASGLARALGAKLTIVYADPFVPPVDFTLPSARGTSSRSSACRRAPRITFAAMPKRTSTPRFRTTSPSASIRRSTASSPRRARRKRT